MSDETSIIEPENEVDNSGDTGIDSGSQQIGSTSNDPSVSAERYWYDDGSGYIDSQTNDPLMYNDGRYVTTPEQLDEYLKNTNASAKTNVQSNAVKTQTPGQDDVPVFGKFDPVKSTGYFKSLMQKNTGYQSQLKARQQPTQENAQQQEQLPNQQNTAQQQEVDIVTQVQEYRDNLSKYALAPLERAAKAMQAAGVWTNENPEAVALSQELHETEANINNLANKKQVELIQKMINDGKTQETTKKQTEEMQQAIQRSRFNVGKEFGGEAGLDWLLCGKSVSDGKGGQKFVRGPGADFVEALVDVVYDGNSDVDPKTAYENVWNKMQKNEQVLNVLATFATAMWLQQNINENNKRVRDEATKAERARQKNNTQKPQGMNHVPESVDGMPPELSKFLGLSSV